VFRSACVTALMLITASVIEAQTSAAPAAPKSTAAAPSAAMKPAQRADSTPKGKLKNPYSDSNKAIVAAGDKLFQGASCSGCHGGTGGGGICPPLANGVWIYGGDDDTLFRLITYGSVTLQSKGYSRMAVENVVAPMPAMGDVVGTDDDLWRIITFIRAQYHGPAECKFGCPPPSGVEH
jgi:mono/diheme cytochrome c family protein